MVRQKPEGSFSKNRKKPFSQNNRKTEKTSDTFSEKPRDRKQRSFEKTEDEEQNADKLEGRNPVLEAFQAGRQINKLWVIKPEGASSDPTMYKIVSLAKKEKVPVVEVQRAVLDQMSITKAHQGVIAAIASHDYVELDTVLEKAKKKNEAPFLVMLDGLKDGYNLGSILRIADAAGVHGVIIPKHRSVGLDSFVSKASAGAIEYVPVVRATNLGQTITALKENGFWVAGTDATGDIHYKKADYKGPLLLIIGSEGEGMSKMVREKCDFLLSIPMMGTVNSLNAAVAAGIVIFEAQSQRIVVQ